MKFAEHFHSPKGMNECVFVLLLVYCIWYVYDLSFSVKLDYYNDIKTIFQPLF